MIGTVFSLERLRRTLEGLGAPPHAMDLWFAQALRDAIASSLAGGYRPVREFLEASLPRVLSSFGLPATPRATGPVMAAFAELEAVPEAEEATRTLAEAGWRILALSHGAEAQIRSLLSRAGLADGFAEVLSSDAVEKTKPHPDVYELARDRAEGELWMVAAHAWDVAGDRGRPDLRLDGEVRRGRAG
jgi:2-haloacid dehalogenase